MPHKALAAALILGLLLFAAPAAAADSGRRAESCISVGAAPTNDDNAHWQVYDDDGENVFACVRDGGPNHGDYDYTWFYNTEPLDLSAGILPELRFRCDVNPVRDTRLTIYQCSSEPTDASILTSGEFVAVLHDTDGEQSFSLDGSAQTYIAFLWQSEMFVGPGPTVDRIKIVAEDWLEPEWLWTTSEDQDPDGEYLELDLGGHPKLQLGFWFSDDGFDGDCYWCIDNLSVSTQGWPLWGWDFNGADPGWEQEQYSGDGLWGHYDTAQHAVGGMNDGFYAAGDPFGGNDDYDVECRTPIIYEDYYYGEPDQAFFMSNFQDYAGYGQCGVVLYAYDSYYELEDDCDTLAAWSTVDEGNSPVRPASWGAIKALDKLMD